MGKKGSDDEEIALPLLLLHGAHGCVGKIKSGFPFGEARAKTKQVLIHFSVRRKLTYEDALIENIPSVTSTSSGTYLCLQCASGNRRVRVCVCVCVGGGEGWG